MNRPKETALGSAHARFLEGLPRRAEELRAASRTLREHAGETEAREGMRRHLLALCASSQVFREDALAGEAQSVIARLDAAREEGRALGDADFEALAALAQRLEAGSSSSDAALLEPASSGANFDDDASSAGAAANSSGGVSSLPTSQGSTPMIVTRTVSGLLAAPATLVYLVVDAPATQARMRELLPAARFTILGTSDPAEAVRLLHAESPDYAFVSAELAIRPEVDLVRRLARDPLSVLRGVHVILPEGATYDGEFVEQTGAHGVFVEPLGLAQLAEIERACVGPTRTRSSLEQLAEGTVDDIAASVAEEVRRGITESLQVGRHERLRLDDRGALMAAAWSAVGRVRAHLAEQGGGRLRFRDDHGSEGPTFLSLSSVQTTPLRESSPDGASANERLDLSGLRVLVADDDPTVLWFFAGLLRETGAAVIEAHNGREALELARRKRPHLVVSDILMPKIDGFALCRELKRDVQLAHVPVILLSWKEDFLQRMRELDAGASGYLRKEAGSRQILRSVADALAPRLRLRSQLRAEGEVRGRIEGLGVVPLLETVAKARPSSHIALRDAFHLFEIELRAGQRVTVTRTAADGSFARGEDALMQLLGVVAGRFSVRSDDAPVRAALPEPLDVAIERAGKRLGALLDAVSDTRLLQIARIELHDEAAAGLLEHTPTPLAEIVASLRGNADAPPATPRELLLRGKFAPAELEEGLRELARRGALVSVRTALGDDLVAAALREREQRPGTLLHSSHPPPRAPFAKDAHASDAHSANEPETEEAVLPTLSATESVSGAPTSVVADEVRALRAAAPRDDKASSTTARPAPSGVSEPRGVRAGKNAGENAQTRSGERVRRALLLLAFALLGFFGFRALERELTGASRVQRQTSVERNAIDSTTTTARTTPQTEASNAPATIPARAAEPATPDDDIGPDTYGRILPFIDRSRGVEVAEGHGLLVLEIEGEGDAPRIYVGQRDLGTPPLAVALPEGRHEIVLRHGDHKSFRYLIVRRGETRVLAVQRDRR